ncbi:hypothetical protein C823_007477 [Eubacterium plexicaudatum ASF492]|nr:hypothetical protein C823_007477 [Eubacterium plexicaudatum ASF492]
MNPFVKVEIFTCKVEKSNIHKLISQYQVILDCPDNYETRYICKKQQQNKIRRLFMAVCLFEGQIVTFKPNTACYYCAFPGNMEGRNQDIYSKRGFFHQLLQLLVQYRRLRLLKKFSILIWHT